MEKSLKYGLNIKVKDYLVQGELRFPVRTTDVYKAWFTLEVYGDCDASTNEGNFLEQFSTVTM